MQIEMRRLVAVQLGEHVVAGLLYTMDGLLSRHVCRYAGLLEAAMSRHVPKVGPIDSKELLDFCADSGYNCRLEPSGTLLMPPEYNVGMTDWERSIRLR